MSNTRVNKKDTKIKSLYGKECTLSKDEFINTYDINMSGLTSTEANERLSKYGFNEISQAKPKKWYNYFLESLFTPFNSILLRYCTYFVLYGCVSC